MTQIDIKTLYVISILTILSILTIHLIIITQFEFEQKALFVNLSLISSITITCVFLVDIIRNYQGAKGIVVAFVLLFISYIAYLFGEVLWFVYESVLGVYPYPSVADVGFFFYFVFTALFLISIVRCFRDLTKYDVGVSILITSIVSAVYLALSLETHADPFDITFGAIFIIASSTVFGLSVIAFVKLRLMAFGAAWGLILISAIITTFSDIWYYTLENIGAYTYDHITNTLWIVSDAVLVFALLIHKRNI